jgi:hypothetical protein
VTQRTRRKPLPSIRLATRRYEAWLGLQLPVVKRDLRVKHENMKGDRLSFLVATFYRWMQNLPFFCEALMSAPFVLAVGDLHVENFGTWRDVDDRVVWGIYNFDEAYSLPYTLDLLRLATSAVLAWADQRVPLRPRGACSAILDGYTSSLRSGGRPIILGERHARLRGLLYDGPHDDPQVFWQHTVKLPSPERRVPPGAISLIERSLPEPHLAYRIVARTDGTGSLGRPCYVALGDWHGGKIGREVKMLTSSAFLWAAGKPPNGDLLYESTIRGAVRSPDPFLRIDGNWVARRYGPETGRLTLPRVSKREDAYRLLRAMGWETANIHLGTKSSVGAIKRDLGKRGSDWLFAAAKRMASDVEFDWVDWSRQRKLPRWRRNRAIWS